MNLTSSLHQVVIEVVVVEHSNLGFAILIGNPCFKLDCPARENHVNEVEAVEVVVLRC